VVCREGTAALPTAKADSKLARRVAVGLRQAGWILDECWRPPLSSLPAPGPLEPRRDLEEHLRFYNFDRVPHGRRTAGQIPADIVYGSRKMEVR
jgi:hypothetical protein